MKQRVHIVASCADRKVLDVPPERRLRSHRARGARSRFDSFVGALSEADGETRAARDLYAGPYWAVVRELPEIAAAAGLDAQLWVASAGYGLVPADAQLQGYSATFRTGERDSVGTSDDETPVADQLAAWWAALATWQGPARGAPRSFPQLVGCGDAIVVLASPRYVQAMANDLRAAARLVGDRLLVVTSLEPSPEDPLAENIVPSLESLIGYVAGSRPALHARVTRHILENVREHPLSARGLRARYQRLARTSKYERIPDRAPMSDDEVRTFIRRELREDPSGTHTGLLRVLRSGGRACEQKRFRSLFREEAGNAR
jgi:hypothetical protein